MLNTASLWLMLATALSAGENDAPLARYRFSQVHMGMTFELTFYAGDEAAANQAAEAAFQRIGQLDSILSDYKPDSELSQLSNTAGSGKTVPLSDPLWDVLW